LLQGGLHPDLPDRLLRKLAAFLESAVIRKSICTAFRRRKYCASRKSAEISIRETIQRLMDAGLQSIPAAARKFSTMKSREDCPPEVHQR